MSISTQEFNDQVALWQSAEPGNLAQNFHALQAQGPTADDGPVNLQFVKGTSFPIADFSELKDKADRVTMIKIWMTMKKFEPTSIGFEPVLQVFYKDDAGNISNFLLNGGARNAILGDTEPIPAPFVHNTTTLWAELESENLPGVFEVRGRTGQMQRVQFYVVEGEGLEIMKLLFPNMSGMSILPGLDLNKSVNPEDTVFIPIVNIKAPLETIDFAPISNGNLSGVHWVLRDGDDDNYFDFNNPCPPLCPPD